MSITDLIKKSVQTERRLDELEVCDLAPVVAKYTLSGNQGVNSGVESRINFDSKIYDTYNAVTTGASWVFTAPIAGYYQLSGYLSMASSSNWAVGEGARIHIYINGAEHTPRLAAHYGESGGALAKVLSGSTIVHLNKGDTLYLTLYHNSGSAEQIGTMTDVSIHKI